MSTIYDRITAFNKDLLPDMVQLKYQAMAENEYRFYRGTCHLFYEDLNAAAPLPPSPVTWISGDLHLENFGSYKADNRLVYFDLNDFDEGILAPASWELVRMITSIFIAFDNLEIEELKAVNMAQQFLRNYAATLVKGKAMGIDPRTAKGIVCAFLTAVEKRKQKDLLKKRTIAKKKKIALSLEHEKQFELDKQLRKELEQHINDWIETSSDGPYNYKVLDTIFRLAGTGSVGVKRYLFLLKSLNTKNKYLFLDMKEARASSLQHYVKVKQPAWASEAERVIDVQQRMQSVLPALQGVTIFNNEAYTLQEMQPTEDKINFELIKDAYRDIYQVIDDMAMLTASAQLRSGGRQGSAIIDELIIYGEDTQWHEAILKYAMQYAKQVKRDYKEYVKGYKKGKYRVKEINEINFQKVLKV
jgi:uncharacterized protein (DUF2252 family)